MSILLGCIADDFTGATDLAGTLVREGMRAIQMIGAPTGEVPDADAVVIALKSRTPANSLTLPLPMGMRATGSASTAQRSEF